MADPVIVGEEEIVQGYLAPLAARLAGAYGLTDDCATLGVPDGHELVVTTDALVEGVHFLPGEAADAIGWKALAVNVSDLVAKGASPLAYVLSLALPEAPRRGWMQGLADGLARAQAAFGIELAGGDTDRTPGHLGVSVTAFGIVTTGGMVRRSGAKSGDLVYVSGTIGDAALGLRLARDPSLATAWGLEAGEAELLLKRFRFPEPRVGLGPVVAAFASASMDVSDGLGKDLGRLCRASGVGARIEAGSVPLSRPARAVLSRGGARPVDLIGGGEDYEILCTVPPGRSTAFEAAAREAGASCAAIGWIAGGGPPAFVDAHGRELGLAVPGWDHF